MRNLIMNTSGRNGHALPFPGMRIAACGILLISVLPPALQAEEFRASRHDEETVTDRWHRALSRRVLRLAESINNGITGVFRRDARQDTELTQQFYGNLMTAYDVKGSYIRLRPRAYLSEHDGSKYKLDFSARLRIPHITRKLSFYADSDDADYDAMEDVFSARYRRALEREYGDGATAGLTYFFTDRMKRDLSLSTGLRFRPEPSPKIRLRARFRKSFEVWLAEFSQSVFWSERDGSGEKSELVFDRRINDLQHLGINVSAIWSELSHGVDWGGSAAYYVRFDRRNNGALRLGMRGYTHPSAITDQYFVRLTWRRRVHRDWLFIEVEPGLDFFREDDFGISPLINLKIEMLIGSYTRL